MCTDINSKIVPNVILHSNGALLHGIFSTIPFYLRYLRKLQNRLVFLKKWNFNHIYKILTQNFDFLTVLFHLDSCHYSKNKNKLIFVYVRALNFSADISLPFRYRTEFLLVYLILPSFQHWYQNDCISFTTNFYI